ncbi:MAG: hypothetical protein K2X77_08120 [Candidatus Obscuribacterales bacterium]|nr:hypothetical protein [Candidatus Obscuribacterales bacterium]
MSQSRQIRVSKIQLSKFELVGVVGMENKDEINSGTEGGAMRSPICMSMLAGANSHRQTRRRRSPRNRRLFLTAIDGKEKDSEIAGSYWMCSRFMMP